MQTTPASEFEANSFNFDKHTTRCWNPSRLIISLVLTWRRLNVKTSGLTFTLQKWKRTEHFYTPFEITSLGQALLSDSNGQQMPLGTTNSSYHPSLLPARGAVLITLASWAPWLASQWFRGCIEQAEVKGQLQRRSRVLPYTAVGLQLRALCLPQFLSDFSIKCTSCRSTGKQGRHCLWLVPLITNCLIGPALKIHYISLLTF